MNIYISVSAVEVLMKKKDRKSKDYFGIDNFSKRKANAWQTAFASNSNKVYRICSFKMNKHYIKSTTQKFANEVASCIVCSHCSAKSVSSVSSVILFRVHKNLQSCYIFNKRSNFTIGNISVH